MRGRPSGRHLAHPIRHGALAGVTRRQRFGDRREICLRTVLRELRLRLDAVDPDLDAHDRAAALKMNDRARRLTDHGVAAPVSAAASTAGPGDPSMLCVVVRDKVPVDVHDLVVPGRHHPPVLLLGRIPTGADIGVGTAHDHQAGRPVRLPLLVVSRDMAVQSSAVIAEEQRQRCGVETACRTVTRSASAPASRNERSRSSEAAKCAGTYTAPLSNTRRSGFNLIQSPSPMTGFAGSLTASVSRG